MNDQDWRQLDWSALERLRNLFLEGSSGRADYWRSGGDLAAYDITFGRRIEWKWQFVLRQLDELNWTPPAGRVLDFGCGSGNASRAVLRHFGTAGRQLALADRSRLAMEYARDKVQAEFPTLEVRIAGDQAPGAEACDVLVVSHVINELSDSQLEGLMRRCGSARSVLWVEPGTHADSRRLIAAREKLRGQFNIVAPCTHQGACGLLAPGEERHWCHFFADSPPEVHTDGNWVKFGRLAGIDLRACPLSFLVLDKRPVAPPPAGSVRILGRARLYKAYALLFGCDESGVRDRRILKRNFAEEFRQLKRGRGQSLRTGPWSEPRGKEGAGEQSSPAEDNPPAREDGP